MRQPAIRPYRLAVAFEILKKVNYYRLSAYGIGLKQKDDKERYVDGISLEHIYRLALFLGIPVGILIFSALYSSAHTGDNTSGRERSESFVSNIRFAPPLLGSVAVAPLRRGAPVVRPLGDYLPFSFELSR